ncbi:MAG: Flp pilus assembly protein CpaB [Chloroflexi bacterium]|nr:MAG: Flp pilus assembly protein CpaB [Chloroflexota bacterium]
MEMEYQDPRRRGKFIIVLGVLLAVAAGGAAFYLINQAQQNAGAAGIQKVPIVVATRVIPARKPVETDDVMVRDVPIDKTNEQGVISDPSKVIGRILAVSVLEGQMVTTNLLASAATGGQFSIIGPGETIGPGSENWRAVSITVPDDRAVGGLIEANATVDVFVTATVIVPQEQLDLGRFYTDKSTKLTYQNVLVLAKSSTFYVLKVSEPIAEEISHLQASGSAQFSLALRPEDDSRTVDASKLGETTNLIIQRYGLPVPQTYPTGKGGSSGPVPTPFPTASPRASRTPSPSAAP